MRIAIIGTGYVGLVAGACFADTGNHVTCVDSDPQKIDSLNRGVIPIYEPGLEHLVKRGCESGRLKFTCSTEVAVSNCELIFLAVGTPTTPTGEADLKYLKAAVEQISRAMTGYRLIINKSTVPIGTYRQVQEWIAAFTKHPFHIASNPEFLKEGTAVDDFLKPDRVIIGTDDEKVYKKLAELYAPFVRQGNPVLWMSPVSAEISKYACNSFLATRISFMNEIANLCEKVGGDIEQVRGGMVSDARIGRHFLYAGVGYGGSCFPKDIRALMANAEKQGITLGIVRAAEEANLKQKRVLAEKVRAKFGPKLDGHIFALWGLAFKPNTDDMREAPSLEIIYELLKSGARIQAYDPVANEKASEILGDQISYSSSPYQALENATALLVVTEWNEFRNPDFELIRNTLRQPVIFDGRNLYSPEIMREYGFTYFGIGRGRSN